MDLQDLSIVLAVRSHNPTMLTADFLRGSGVIGGDWELARPPVLSQQASQCIFKNGVRIEARGGTVSFSEALGNKEPETIQVPEVARRYAAALPNLDYRGVGVNPRWFVTFAGDPEAARRYLTGTLLSSGPWQDLGTGPVQAGVNLLYALERCQLRLGISEAKIRLPEREAPAVLFDGNFHYDASGESPEARLESLSQAIARWQEDLDAYRQLVEDQFLAGVEGREASSFLFPEVSN